MPTPELSPDVFAALAHPARRRILQLLRTGPRPSGEIAAAFDLSRPAFTEHLRMLQMAGLVREEARGRQRIYHLEGGGLAAAREWLRPFELSWRRRMRANDIVDEEDA